MGVRPVVTCTPPIRVGRPAHLAATPRFSEARRRTMGSVRRTASRAGLEEDMAARTLWCYSHIITAEGIFQLKPSKIAHSVAAEQ